MYATSLFLSSLKKEENAPIVLFVYITNPRFLGNLTRINNIVEILKKIAFKCLWKPVSTHRFQKLVLCKKEHLRDWSERTEWKEPEQ